MTPKSKKIKAWAIVGKRNRLVQFRDSPPIFWSINRRGAEQVVKTSKKTLKWKVVPITIIL